MKKIILIAASFVAFTLFSSAQETVKSSVSQGEFARVAADYFGLAKTLSANYDATEAINALHANGITPFGGKWKANEPLKMGDFAKALVTALNLTSQIPEERRAVPRAYVDLLKDRGIELNSVAEALAQAGKVIAAPTHAAHQRIINSTDPLYNRNFFGPVDVIGSGVDLSSNISGSRSTSGTDVSTQAAEPQPDPEPAAPAASSSPAPAVHTPVASSSPAPQTQAAPAPTPSPQVITRTRRIIRVVRPPSPSPSR